jgi:hypothetical protein
MAAEMKDDGSDGDDSMGLFSAFAAGFMPPACMGGNLIAPSEKTSPGPSYNGWVSFYSKMKPLI